MEMDRNVKDRDERERTEHTSRMPHFWREMWPRLHLMSISCAGQGLATPSRRHCSDVMEVDKECRTEEMKQ